MSDFACLLRAYRLGAGLSQLRLCDKAGLNNSYVHHLEAGRKHPTRCTVEALITALDLEGLEADALRIAAGFCPDFAIDASVLRLAYLLETLPKPQADRLRDVLERIG